MKFEKTIIPGVFRIQSDVHRDNRGYFFRTFDKEELLKHDIHFNIVQTSESNTRYKGSIRGIHYQTTPYEEEKIVRCIKGKIFDVVVDLRKKSPTYAQWVSFLLSERNHDILYIPKGCAHGFQTLTDMCVVDYYMSRIYSPAHAQGIAWNDPTLNITWPIHSPKYISVRDKHFPNLHL